MNRYLTAALMSIVIIAVPLSATASHVGPFKFHISPQSLDFGQVDMGKNLAKHFTITNNMACGIRFTFRTTGDRSFVSSCSGLSNLHEILPSRYSSCKVTYRPRSKAVRKEQMVITVSYGITCRDLAMNRVKAKHKPMIDRATKKRDAHNQAGPDYEALDLSHKKAAATFTDRQTELKEKIRNLKADQPEVDRLRARMVKMNHAMRARDRKYTASYKKLKRKGPDLTVFKKILDEVEREGKAELSKTEQQVKSACDKIGQLMAEKKREMDLLRRGRFCKGCGRTTEKLRRDGVRDVAEHVRRNGGYRPAKPHEIDRALRKWTSRIDSAVRKCNSMRPKVEQVRKKWHKKYADIQKRKKLLKKRHKVRLKALADRVKEFGRRWIERKREHINAISRAEERHEAKYRAAVKALEKLKRNWKLRVAGYKLKRKKILARYNKERTRLQKELDRTIKYQKDAFRRTATSLKETKTVSVSLRAITQ